MSTSPTKGGSGPRIGVLGHVGNRNLGDEATLAAVFGNLASRSPRAAFTGITMRPGDTRKRHGVPAWPLRRGVDEELARPSEGDNEEEASPSSAAAGEDGVRTAHAEAPEEARRSSLVASVAGLLKRIPGLRSVVRFLRSAGRAIRSTALEVPFLVRSYGRVRSLDALLIVGSQQVNDYVDGPWGFPYTLLKWTALARAAGVQVAYVSVGAGPVKTTLGHLMLRLGLSLASYRSFRDPGALRIGEELGLEDHECAVVPDLAFSLRPGSGGSAEGDPNGNAAPRVVGINALPFLADYYWHRSDPAVHEAYRDALADFSRRIVGQDYRILFFATHLDVDPVIARNIISRMGKRGTEGLPPDRDDRVQLARISDLEELRRAYQKMDVAVATRYHGFVLGVLEGLPVLPLSYHPKFSELADMMGTGDYVMDASDMTGDGIAERFGALERNREEVEKLQSRALERFRNDLDRQYDLLLELSSRRDDG